MCFTITCFLLSESLCLGQDAEDLGSRDSHNLVEITTVPTSSPRCWLWHCLFQGDHVSQDLIISGLLSKSEYFVIFQTCINLKKNFFNAKRIHFILSMALCDVKRVL